MPIAERSRAVLCNTHMTAAARKPRGRELMIPYRPAVRQPCSDCPFRRLALPGWLGRGSPESFLHCIHTDDPLPCHQTIDYDDPRWKEQWVSQSTGSMCAGALILSANMYKLPRDPNFPRMAPDEGAVFATALEFVRHHRESAVRSWDDDDQTVETRHLQQLIEMQARKSGQPLQAPKKTRRRQAGARP